MADLIITAIYLKYTKFYSSLPYLVVEIQLI